MKLNSQISHTDVLWHPNFRVVATLPDTKVIRTAFLVNFVAIGLVVATGALLALREQSLAEMRAQTVALDSRIAENAPKYAQAVKLQKEFTELEKRLKVVDSFVTSDFVASKFLRRLAETLPRYFTIDAVEVSEGGVRVKGSIMGSSGKATDIAMAYVAQLKADSDLSGPMQGVMLNTITRDPSANRMVFEIEMKTKPRK
ncbi:MAG: hypothetical protein IPL39_17115 [Opitutaceae bacterium]|nr:hypothetical protein [Opitutaceae bacterium]